MENITYYEMLLYDRFRDIYTASTILILVGSVIGIFGNLAIIIIYRFWIKERGERYFLPLLAVVDLIACFTNSCYYIMDNIFFYTYPNDAICSTLSFLQICVPAMSAHALLVISVQRYRLVCKPLSPKMSLKYKRILFFATCLVAFIYSCPVIFFSGVQETKQTFMNHTVRTRICKFSTINSSSFNVYFGILTLIAVGNLIATISLFVPIMKQISRVSSGFKIKTKPNTQEVSQTSVITSDIDIELTEKEDTPHSTCGKGQNESENNANPGSQDDKIYRTEIAHTNKQCVGSKASIKTSKHRSAAQKRITIMFFVIILVYVISFIPSLGILVAIYAIDDFSYIKLSRPETAAWIIFARFVFINHIANPLICVYFDIKFRTELLTFFRWICSPCKLCTAKNSTFMINA